MNKYKEKVLEEITDRILKHPFAEEDIEILVNSFIKVYNLPDELIIYNNVDIKGIIEKQLKSAKDTEKDFAFIDNESPMRDANKLYIEMLEGLEKLLK